MSSESEAYPSSPEVLICGLKLSNSTILWAGAISFGLFVIAEIIGALAANSLSLLSDAAAMSIDINAYLTNLYAEYVKKKYGRMNTRRRLFAEVAIPTFSACLLIAVTVYVLIESIRILRTDSDEESVDVRILFGFSSANMLIDVFMLLLFCHRGPSSFYDPGDGDHREMELVSAANSQHPGSEDETEAANVSNGNVNTGHYLEKANRLEHQHTLDHAANDLHECTENSAPMDEGKTFLVAKLLNTNMMSAFTHISGDTLRTIAVFGAAVIATTSNISSAALDAYAAIVVSITIICILIPLIKEIASSSRRIWKAHAIKLEAQKSMSSPTSPSK